MATDDKEWAELVKLFEENDVKIRRPNKAELHNAMLEKRTGEGNPATDGIVIFISIVVLLYMIGSIFT